MHIANVKHFFYTLLRVRPAPARVRTAEGAQPPLNFDPFWHGDHWQNLLSSPMDARHYVMEDWTVSSWDEVDARYAAVAKSRRRGRRAA